MPLKTTDKDLGHRKLRKEMKKLNNSFVTAGVHKGAGNYSGQGQTVSVAMVAAWNEFGTRKMPARPWMRSAVDTNRDKLTRMNVKEFRKVSDGKRTAKQSLDRLGFALQTFMVNRIQKSNTWAVPNRPSTARRKRRGGALRGPTPLINSSLMMRSITFKSTIRGAG